MVRLNQDLGRPVMRPLFLQYETDREAYSQDYQYMYGEDLLVAPVLLPDLDTWTLHLPGPDTWRHLWSDLVVEGPGQHQVSAPLGNPPVFYREGSAWTDVFLEIRNQFSLI